MGLHSPETQGHLLYKLCERLGIPLDLNRPDFVMICVLSSNKDSEDSLSTVNVGLFPLTVLLIFKHLESLMYYHLMVGFLRLRFAYRYDVARVKFINKIELRKTTIS